MLNYDFSVGHKYQKVWDIKGSNTMKYKYYKQIRKNAKNI